MGKDKVDDMTSKMYQKISYSDEGWTELKKFHFKWLLFIFLVISISMILFTIMCFYDLHSFYVALISTIFMEIIVIYGVFWIYYTFITYVTIDVYDNKMIIWYAVKKKQLRDSQKKKEYYFNNIIQIKLISTDYLNDMRAELYMKSGEKIMIKLNDVDEYNKLSLQIEKYKNLHS